MEVSLVGHPILVEEQLYQPNFLHGEQLLHYGTMLQSAGQLYGNRNLIMSTSSQRHEDASGVSMVLPSQATAIATIDPVHQRLLMKVKKPTGSTAARLLAEQYNKDRSSHSSQTDLLPSTVPITRPKVPRLPPKKNSCLLCHAEIPENQRDRHVLRYHLKKPVYRCPLCDFVSMAEPSIVRTHLRLKHREFDLAAVNCRQDFAEELSSLTRQCFGPKKRFIRQSAVDGVERVDADGVELPTRSNKSMSKVRTTAADPTPIQCRICVAKTTVQSDQVKIHAAQCHLHLPYLYGCPQIGCLFGSYTCLKTVKAHIQQEHGLETKVISEANKNRKEIKKTVIECFGEAAWSN